MKEILTGLEKFGLDELLTDVPKANWPTIETTPVDDLDRYIFDKKFDCACCKHNFTNWYPKEKRARLIRLDTDLRPIYEPIDPSFYDVIVCPMCGYAAVFDSFTKILPFQKENVQTKISPYFRNASYTQHYTVIDAIERYKLALLNSMVKDPKREGERGFLALKLSWFYKELGDAANQKIFATLAFTGLSNALAEENPPIMGMGYDTLFYVVGALAIYLNKRETALQFISKVVTSRSASKQLKEMAFDLKEQLKVD